MEYKLSSNQEYVLTMMASRLPESFMAQPPEKESVSGEFLFLSGVDEDEQGNPIDRKKIYNMEVPRRKRIDHEKRLRKIHKKSGRDGVFNYIKSYFMTEDRDSDDITKAVKDLKEYFYDSGNYEDDPLTFVRKNTFYKIQKFWDEIKALNEKIRLDSNKIKYYVGKKWTDEVRATLHWHSVKRESLDDPEVIETIHIPIPVGFKDKEAYIAMMKKPEKIGKVDYLLNDCQLNRIRVEQKCDKMIEFIADRKVQGWMNKKDLKLTDEWLEKAYNMIRL